MKKVIYDVPLEAQAKRNTCWNASALMIWRYWQGVSGRQGPMHSLSSKWANDNPIYPDEFIKLAENVGLKHATTLESHTSSTLSNILEKQGPIWCAGYWFGVGHIIVLTGIDGNKIYFNDPDKGVKKWGSVGWFNLKSASEYAGFMMSKDPKAY